MKNVLTVSAVAVAAVLGGASLDTTTWYSTGTLATLQAGCTALNGNGVTTSWVTP